MEVSPSLDPDVPLEDGYEEDRAFVFVSVPFVVSLVVHDPSLLVSSMFVVPKSSRLLLVPVDDGGGGGDLDNDRGLNSDMRDDGGGGDLGRIGGSLDVWMEPVFDTDETFVLEGLVPISSSSLASSKVGRPTCDDPPLKFRDE